MDMLIILTYTALCIGIFKLFKIPLNKWSVPTAVLGGIGILSTIMIAMNYNHPYAKFSKEVFVSVPIIPQVTGTVKEVHAKANVPVKKGGILFTLENDKQQIALRKAKAALEEAKSIAYQKDQGLVSAIANTEKAQAAVQKAEANLNRTFSTYQRYTEAHTKGGENSPFTDGQIERQKELYNSAKASVDIAHSTLDAAESEQERVRLDADSNIYGENTRVAQLIEAVKHAELELEYTIVRAPADGIPTQIALAPGFRSASIPLRPSMVFIPDTGKRQIAGMFWQNSLRRLQPGLETEMILDSQPGKVFTGKLVSVLPAMREGEVQANGTLVSASTLTRHGFAVGIIELDEDLDNYELPMGVQGQAVVLNHEGDILHTSIVRRVLLRMMSWLKYVWPMK